MPLYANTFHSVVAYISDDGTKMDLHCFYIYDYTNTVQYVHTHKHKQKHKDGKDAKKT